MKTDLFSFRSSAFFQWLTKSPAETSPFKASKIMSLVFKRQGVKEAAQKISSWSFPLKTGGKWLLAILVFSCIFVPRWTTFLGSISIDLRLEDFLLLGLALMAAALAAVSGSEDVPLQKGSVAFVQNRFLIFILACMVSIGAGFSALTIDKPLVSFFYLLKWVEYFALFSLSAYFTQDRKSAVFLIRTFFLLGLALAAYGYWEMSFPSDPVVYPNYYRLFERFPFYGDANHIGAVFVLWIGFFLAFFLKARNRRVEFFLATALLAVFVPFLLTYSRKGYLAFVAVLGAAFVVKGSRRKLLALILFCFLIVLLLPSRVPERIFGVGEALASDNRFNSSWARNVDVWKLSLWNFQHFWLLGSGLGSRDRIFYESQYIMVLTETGLVGLLSFFGMILSPVRSLLAKKSEKKDSDQEAVALGYGLGFIGLLIHNLSCVSWTVVKGAFIFWFVTGVTLSFLQMRDWGRKAPAVFL